MEKRERGGMSGKGVWAHLFHEQVVPLPDETEGGFLKGQVFSNAGGLSNGGGPSLVMWYAGVASLLVMWHMRGWGWWWQCHPCHHRW